MKLQKTETGFTLYKENRCIGLCDAVSTANGAALHTLCIDPQWRRKGYGSYLLKEVLRSFGGYDRQLATVFTAPLPTTRQRPLFGPSSAFLPKAASWYAATLRI